MLTSEPAAKQQSCGTSYLVFLQGLHHQRVILPELSKQLAPVRGPFEQDLICNNVKDSKTDHTTPVNIKVVANLSIFYLPLMEREDSPPPPPLTGPRTFSAGTTPSYVTGCPCA